MSQIKYAAEILVEGQSKKLYDLLLPQITKRKRSTIIIKKTKKGVLLKITATDSVALRATLNGLTQLLTVYEKTAKVE
ncbi:KEOPS complex subunit Pcc1 [Nanoarchaeota archaeon]